MTMTSLVMIPGLACTGRLFEAQGAALADDFAVSVAQHGRRMTLPADAQAILDDAPERFVLMGLSMGGYLAFEIVRKAPERVERLVLLDTSARPDTPEQTERRLEQIAMAEDGRLDEVSAALFPLLVHQDRREDAALERIVRRMARDTGPDRFADQQRVIMSRPDSRPDLASIRCPTLVMVGGGDMLTPPDLAREIADGIDGASLATVPEAGHLSTLEQPETVNRILMDWLAK